MSPAVWAEATSSSSPMRSHRLSGTSTLIASGWTAPMQYSSNSILQPLRSEPEGVETESPSDGSSFAPSRSSHSARHRC